MDKDRNKTVIKLSSLEKLQSLFQKEKGELIDLYIQETQQKMSQLYAALESNNISKLAHIAQELRYRSVDMGAIQFSHYCLSIEIAAQECRLESIKKHLALLENQFTIIKDYFETLKEPA
jgi:primosomal protein N''